jgi:hypothetical protein
MSRLTPQPRALITPTHLTILHGMHPPAIHSNVHPLLPFQTHLFLLTLTPWHLHSGNLQKEKLLEISLTHLTCFLQLQTNKLPVPLMKPVPHSFSIFFHYSLSVLFPLHVGESYAIIILWLYTATLSIVHTNSVLLVMVLPSANFLTDTLLKSLLDYLQHISSLFNSQSVSKAEVIYLFKHTLPHFLLSITITHNTGPLFEPSFNSISKICLSLFRAKLFEKYSLYIFRILYIYSTIYTPQRKY